MSIVERALQKAQSKAKPETTTPAASEQSIEPVPGATGTGLQAAVGASAPETPVVPSPLASGPRAGSVRDDATRPSRDLKAIVRVDVGALRAAGRLPSPDLAQQTEDEIRRVKWPLLKAIHGAEGVQAARNNVILVTSALAGEGKTFTSLNLAMSIVRDRELRVVLVDGDLARPGLTPTLGLEGRPGLVDALEDTSFDVSDITYQTDVEGLFFVPSGKWHPHAPEYFAGSRMPEIIESLDRRVGHGVIILDSPPLLATNEAQVASRFAGQVLLVVRADNTEQQAVLDALALVDKATPVSAVLNRVEPSALSRYYGQYYYGSGYGRGYSRDRAAGQ